MHGGCTTDVSREPAGHRRIIALADREALPHGHRRPDIAQHSFQCECDTRIYADFAQRLIGITRKQYIDKPCCVDLANTAHPLESTPIDLSRSLFLWAPYQNAEAAVKMHTLLYLCGNIPSFIHISDGTIHDVSILDQLIPDAGTFYVMDRSCGDFQCLYRLHQTGSFLATRAKRSAAHQRRYFYPTGWSAGVFFDQTPVLQGYQSAKDFPETFRGLRYKDSETGRRLLLITGSTALPALIISSLYKARCQVEPLFRWSKVHWGVKGSFGTSRNGAELQIWVVGSVYVLIAIIKKRFNLPRRLYKMLQGFELQPVREKAAGYCVFAHSDDPKFGSRRRPANSILKALGQALPSLYMFTPRATGCRE